MKIGLFGGSFDPVHNGHIAVADYVLQELRLLEVWFLPTGNHPFKGKMLSYEKRKDLIQTAIENRPGIRVFDFDKNFDDFSYTDVLLKKLKRKFPLYSFYFIVGSDCLPEFDKWHNYRWVLENVQIVAIDRLEVDLNLVKKEIVSRIRFIKMPPVPISSTEIRTKIALNQSVEWMIPENITEKVKEYYTKPI